MNGTEEEARAIATDSAVSIPVEMYRAGIRSRTITIPGAIVTVAAENERIRHVVRNGQLVGIVELSELPEGATYESNH